MKTKDLRERIWIAAGSRDGDRPACMRAALKLLAARGAIIRRVSSLYETEPVGLARDRTLLNGVIELADGPPPEELMARCLDVERDLGRRRSDGVDGARPIDLDLLLYGDRIVGQTGLTLPHPRMHLRRFVLVPLAEVAPEAFHPLLGKTAGELLAECSDRAWVRRFAPPEKWLVEVA